MDSDPLSKKKEDPIFSFSENYQFFLGKNCIWCASFLMALPLLNVAEFDQFEKCESSFGC